MLFHYDFLAFSATNFFLYNFLLKLQVCIEFCRLITYNPHLVFVNLQNKIRSISYFEKNICGSSFPEANLRNKMPITQHVGTCFHTISISETKSGSSGFFVSYFE